MLSALFYFIDVNYKHVILSRKFHYISELFDFMTSELSFCMQWIAISTSVYIIVLLTTDSVEFHNHTIHIFPCTLNDYC